MSNFDWAKHQMDFLNKYESRVLEFPSGARLKFNAPTEIKEILGTDFEYFYYDAVDDFEWTELIQYYIETGRLKI